MEDDEKVVGEPDQYGRKQDKRVYRTGVRTESRRRDGRRRRTSKGRGLSEYWSKKNLQNRMYGGGTDGPDEPGGR